MRIAQIILTGTSEYERKSQRADRQALGEHHEVIGTTVAEAVSSGADVVHVYAGAPLPPATFRRFPLPYVSSADVRSARWSLRRAVAPRIVASPLVPPSESGRFRQLPEVVEESYFAAAPPRLASPGEGRIIGSFDRRAVRHVVEQTLGRIERFRSDVTWHLYERVPTPEDLSSLDAWIDPALDDDDFDGFVAEALVAGLPVVAARTPINVLRLEQGRTGWLAPAGDPNEMTHAILAALFKPEVAESKQSAARQTASKFRPRQRARVLATLYNTLIS